MAMPFFGTSDRSWLHAPPIQPRLAPATLDHEAETFSTTMTKTSGGWAGADAAPGRHAFKAARILLMATLLAAPLPFGAVQAWAWTALTVVALSLIVLWAVGCVQQKAVKITWSPLYLPVGLFFLFGMVALPGDLTPNRTGTREALLKLLADLIFFFQAGQLWARNASKAYSTLGVTVAIYTFCLSLFAIIQYCSSHMLIYWMVKSPNWAFGPYVNHNHYAGLMEVLIPMAAGCALSRHQSSSPRALLGMAVVLAVASVLLSGSRGGLVALAVEAVLLCSVALWAARPGTRGRIWATMGVGVLAAALLFFWMDPGHISKRLAGVVGVAGQTDVTLGARKAVTLDCLRVLRDHPWLGTGLGTFETVYAPYRSFASDLDWDHAHNDYAQALVETGLVGGALILLAVGTFFSLASDHLGERLRYHQGWIRLGATIGCCGLLIHSFADFNLHIPANAAWFAAAAGWASTRGFPPGLTRA